ncbi:MAG: Rieske (2Fe-2S) domain protein [Pseudonocardia sp.]|nr:Rieske (2Fe-2S) domain protein [Pseudonocardia sp.]
MTAMSSSVQVRVCAVRDVPAGEGIRIERPELPEPIAVFNDGGRLFALSDMCSHADASLADGEVTDCQVECPMHFARFDLVTGRPRSLPALLPVRTYEVTVHDGDVHVTLPEGGAKP